jgi:hypothetical protein
LGRSGRCSACSARCGSTRCAPDPSVEHEAHTT